MTPPSMTGIQFGDSFYQLLQRLKFFTSASTCTRAKRAEDNMSVDLKDLFGGDKITAPWTTGDVVVLKPSSHQRSVGEGQVFIVHSALTTPFIDKGYDAAYMVKIENESTSLWVSSNEITSYHPTVEVECLY